MVETSLVVRDGNSNRNSSPTLSRIPRVSKNMDASCRRKSNNGKRIRKQTRLIRSSGARGRNVVAVSRSFFLVARFPGPLFVRFIGGSALGF